MRFTITASIAALASLISSTAAGPAIGIIDDSNTKAITYQGGNWIHLKNQGSRDYQGTESYSGDGSAYYTFDKVLQNLEIHGGKKFDRGYFDVYLGTGDAYNASCKSACESTILFSTFLPNVESNAAQVITVRNRPYDFRTGKTPYLDLDYVLFEN